MNALNMLKSFRIFFPIWLVALGIGFLFVRIEESRMMLGATLVAIGLTVLLRQFGFLDGMFIERN